MKPRVEIVEVERLVAANVLGAVMVLSASPLLRSDSKSGEKIITHLQPRCYRITSSEVIEDPEFLAGRTRLTVILIHESCPPEPHSCHKDDRDIPKELDLA